MIRDLMKIGLLAGAVALAPGLVAAQQSSTPPKNTTTGSPGTVKSPTADSLDKSSGLKKTNDNKEKGPPVLSSSGEKSRK